MAVRLSVIIPVCNERSTLPEILKRVMEVEIDKEIIVVDNCSVDGTREFLQNIHSPNVEVIFQPRNYGKGTSVRVGIARAKGEYIIIQDADLEYDPNAYHALLSATRDPGCVVVFGRRVAIHGYRQPTGFWLGSKALALLFSLLYGRWVSDVATCYKLVRSEVLQRLKLVSSGFDLDFEIAARLAIAGYRIREVPIAYRPRSVLEGKKIRFRDGFASLIGLCRWRFARRG